MKKAIFLIFVLAIIGSAFYIEYFQSRTSNNTTRNVAGNAPANNPSVAVGQLSPRDVAGNFFQACAAGDWDKAFTYYPMRDGQKELFKNYLGGMELISVGEPYKKFTWYLYPGVQVPYEIKLKSGEMKKYALGVRNDNPKKVWIIDGGV